jgi:hypothetical protein
MDAQELHNLQEAYLQVVENQQRPVEGSIRDGKYVNRPTKRGGRGIKGQPKVDAWGRSEQDRPLQKKEKNESYDLYDLILSHLLDEGYAETPEAAEVIMVNMSEEWREEIVEAYVPWDFGPKQKAKSKYTELLQKKKSEVSKGIVGGRGTATRANVIGRVGTEMRRTLDKDTKETGTDPQKQGLQPSTERHTKAAVRRASKGLPSSSTARKAYG